MCTGTSLPSTAPRCRRHSSPSGTQAHSWVLSVWQEACPSSWRTKKAHGHLRVDEETRHLLLQMSPATIGRLLAGERRTYRLHGLCYTRSTPLGGRIPVQTCMDPPLPIPGVPPVNLVGQGGGQAVGDSLVDTYCHGLYRRMDRGDRMHERRSDCGHCTGILSPQVPGARPLPAF